MRFVSALLLVLMLAITPALAESEQDKTSDKSTESTKCSYVTIPVLYMTDRAASPKGYASQRKIEDGNTIYHVNCGTAEYSVNNSGGKLLTDSQKKLGWLPATKSTPRIQTKVLAGSATSHAYNDFGQAIKDVAARTGSNEFFVIVHGFNTTFAQAAESAAQLAYNLEKPVIVYDWPSKGKPGQYEVDAGNNEWSQEHFDQMIDQLTVIRESGIKFNLLAHSMGNRLAIRSAPVLRGKHTFDQIFLVDADFDAETFVHYMSRYARLTDEMKQLATTNGLQPPKIRVLFSHRDHALPLSEFLYGGYTRLGQAADGMLTSVFNLSAFSNMVNLANNVISCDKDGDKPDASADLMIKFECIDFTALDYGILGHTIPYKLIGSLAANNSPGDGLELVDSDNGSVNKLSKFSLGLFHQKNHISSRIGHCKRVVVLNPKNQAKLASSKPVAN